MKKAAQKTTGASSAAPRKKPASRKRADPPSELPGTLVSAKIDVGFGNSLYIRGTGSGLSWDRGRPMECVSGGLWTCVLSGAREPVTFKVLINDSAWCTGNDYLVEPGQSVTVTPTF